jgi:hypothetical protein
MISTHSVSGGGIELGAAVVAVAVDVDVDVEAVDREWLSSLSGVTDFKLILTLGKVPEFRHQNTRPPKKDSQHVCHLHCHLHSSFSHWSTGGPRTSHGTRVTDEIRFFQHSSWWHLFHAARFITRWIVEAIFVQISVEHPPRSKSSGAIF